MSATSAAVSPASLFEVVVEGLLTVDLPAADRGTVRAVAAAAAAYAEGMPDITRFGVRLAGAALVTTLLVPAGGHLSRVPARRRGRLVTSVAKLPFVAEYVRLARGVGLVCYYDQVTS